MGLGSIEIANAIGISKSLQVFDISHNSITGIGIKIIKEEQDEDKKDEKNQIRRKKPSKLDKDDPTQGTKSFAELFKQGFSEPWARAFRKNESLIHVDMSHNNIRLDDVEIMADGLK